MPHGLDTHRRTRHQVSALRPARLPAPETVTAARQASAPLVVRTAPPETPPARDGAERRGAVVPVDAQHRVAAGRLLAALGWHAATGLVASCRPGAVVVRPGTADSPLVVPVRADAERRLTLPPTALGSLGVNAGDQVVAVAVPATGELHLLAAADVLAQLTGPVADAPAPPAVARPAASRQPQPGAPAVPGRHRLTPPVGDAAHRTDRPSRRHPRRRTERRPR